MKRGLRLIWIGPVYDEDSCLRHSSVSLAGSRWQRRLLRALEGERISAFVSAAIPAPMFPRGPLRATAAGVSVAGGVAGEAVPYWNVPGIRERSAARQIIRAAERKVDQARRADAVVSYNLDARNVLAAQMLRKRKGIPWIAVVADRAQGEGDLLRSGDGPDGCIFLSWWRYVSSDRRHKIHLDGGVDPGELAAARMHWQARPDSIVMYSGSGSQYGGLEALLEAFQRVSLAGARLWISGDALPKKKTRRGTHDERVVYLGRLSEAGLLARWRRVCVFINPRPVSLPESRDNFPSKVLDYLMCGAPVLSTMTEGLSPEYADVLRPLEGTDPDAWAEEIAEALLLNEESRRRAAEDAWTFLERGRTWQAQAARLSQWLREEVLH